MPEPSQGTSESKRLEFEVRGMTCAACVRRVERAIQKVAGVSGVSVNLATERATVEGSASDVSLAQAIEQAIVDSGYEAKQIKSVHAQKEPGSPSDSLPSKSDARNAIPWSLWVATLLSLPIVLLSMGPMIIPGGMDWMMRFVDMDSLNRFLWVLASIVQFGCGRSIYRHAWSSLRAWSPDMNVLVAMGSTAAYLYSSVVIGFPQVLPAEARHVYLESSAVVITLVLLGKYLEDRSKDRARASLHAFSRLQPSYATRWANGLETQVPVTQLAVGDIVLVRGGESIPQDGIIQQGTSTVDESLVTGESMPVSKTVGAPVIGGTINVSGMLHIRVTATNQTSFLARIAQMVIDAQSTKPRIQHTVDQIVAWFAPLVLAIALATALGWLVFGSEDRITHALIHAVAVLIVACPCAMGLATPMSILVGSSRAAELGILFRTGDALQSLSEVQRMVFDKTGTLTRGKPVLERVLPYGTTTSNDVLRVASLAARTSKHPMSAAIAKETAPPQPNERVLESKEIPGEGILSTLSDGGSVELGSVAWFQRLGRLPNEAALELNQSMHLGSSVVCVALKEQYLGCITFRDPLKPEARDVTAEFARSGVVCSILSGDHPSTVETIAKELRVDDAHGGMLPEQKAARVRAWMEQGTPTAFVGDGVNDSPSLATASVGIALGTGTEVAITSAEVILLAGNLQGVWIAWNLAKATMQNIRMNLFWAFGYNVLLIPLATGVLVPSTGWSLSPVLAALAMSFSSLFVVFNALRLKRWKGRMSP